MKTVIYKRYGKIEVFDETAKMLKKKGQLVEEKKELKERKTKEAKQVKSK